MPLESGKYYIASKAGDDRVGQDPIDPGFSFWSIIRAPKDLQEDQLHSVTWTVDQVGGHLYKLFLNGGPAIPTENGVSAPRGAMEEFEWEIIEREGDNSYT
ncbi:hypothetical protein H0H81_008755, partial [Sphagnurus paluster]